MRHILVRHEQGAAHMADGYARATGNVGVAIATSGPGSTNLVTGIATAMLDSIPMVCITGQRVFEAAGNRRVSGSRHHRHHASGHQAQFSGEPREDIAPAPSAMHFKSRAGAVPVPCCRHHQGRGAGSDDLRFRSGQAEAPTARIPCCTWMRSGTGAGSRADSQRQAAGDFGRARRHGVRRHGAGAHAGRARADSRGASRCLASADFPHRIRLCLGMMGMHGEAWVNDAIQEADLLIACGMRFDDRVTGKLTDYAHEGEEDSHRGRSGRDQ
jgi:acetolactate synthase-1/2/3 large subunit